MERIKLNASIRKEIGKNKVNKLRAMNLIPACLYKAGQKTISLKVETRSLYEALHTKAGENAIMDLTIDKMEKKARPVMVKEVQYHPIKDNILHVDFYEISLTEEIKVDVPVVSKGKPEEVTREEGTLEHIMWEIEVECLPTQIPEKIEVDVSALKIGDKIFVKDLSVPPGVKVLNDPELVVMTAEPPRKEEVAEEVPAEEMTEPEVIAKGKKEEEEEAPKEAPPKKEEKKEEKKKE
ncbi:MAG: 50S ribosomal protein L25 [Candidatus Omnitrophica bacterium]|nr:50S ribosomal protein L25 [Candidatus Omnitrophota bacterium]